MVLKKCFAVLVAVGMLLTSVSMIDAAELPVQEELTSFNANVGEIIWDKIDNINVITRIQKESDTIIYQYDSEGNRIRKEAEGIEYLYSYVEEILVEERFNGHIVKYISQNNYGDVMFTGCIIDGIQYVYERDERNYIIGLLNGDGERVL